MPLDDPEVILNLAMERFLRQAHGRFDPGAPVPTQWAQAASAFLKPDTGALRQGQVTLIERWLCDTGGNEEEFRMRRVGITLAVQHVEREPEAAQQAYCDDPDRFIKLADFFAHLDDQLTTGD